MPSTNNTGLLARSPLHHQARRKRQQPTCYNLRMSKTVTTIDQRSSVALTPEALDALGVKAGAELEVEIVGRALVVRSVEEARRSREFISAFESILSKRRTAYEELAKGRDQ